MGFNILAVFGTIGNFLLEALKRGTGAKDNKELLTKIFEVAGGYILSVERTNKKATREGATPLPWEQKLKLAVEAVDDHFKAQGIDVPLHVIVANVANKFSQINEEKLAAGKPGLVSSDNQSAGIYNSYNSSGDKTGRGTHQELVSGQANSLVDTKG